MKSRVKVRPNEMFIDPAFSNNQTDDNHPFDVRGFEEAMNELHNKRRRKQVFNPITIPFDCVMLFNRVKLKPDVSVEDVELALGEMCNVVKEHYRDDGGFIAGQVLEFTGFVSDEGSVANSLDHDRHVAIVTYWKSFDQHEKSHADQTFNEKFSALMEFVEEADELGYRLLWQGEPE